MRRVHLRGHENIRKRVLIHAAGFNLGLLALGGHADRMAEGPSRSPHSGTPQVPKPVTLKSPALAPRPLPGDRRSARQGRTGGPPDQSARAGPVLQGGGKSLGLPKGDIDPGGDGAGDRDQGLPARRTSRQADGLCRAEPSKHPSRGTRRQGSITKAGNSRVRHVAGAGGLDPPVPGSARGRSPTLFLPSPRPCVSCPPATNLPSSPRS